MPVDPAPTRSDVPAGVPHMQQFGTTIFAEMTALAQETGSVNLGQGFPDVDGPAEVHAAAARSVAAGSGANQYAPGMGHPELVAAIIAHQQRHYDIALETDQVLVTVGATEAIAAAILGFITAGDAVLACEPFYDSYPAMTALAGGTLVPLRLDFPEFELQEKALRAAITPRTKMLLLNNPHNPTGKVFTRTELEMIAKIAREHQLLLVTDEVYEHLVFEGQQHIPLATLPGMWERTLTISSASKTFNVTGWKIGWITGPAELIAAVRTVKQFLTYTPATPLQLGVAAGLASEQPLYAPYVADLEAQRDFLAQGLADAGLPVSHAQGSYFILADVRPLGYPDALTFARELPFAAGVVVVPASSFYQDLAEDDPARALARFAFCKQLPVLEQAVRTIQEFAATRRLHRPEKPAN